MVAAPHPSLRPLRIAALAAVLAAAFVATLSLPATRTSPPASADTATVAAERSYGDLPLAFEPNAGRFDPAVDFTAKAQSGSVALTERGAVIASSSKEGPSEAIAVRFPGADLSSASATGRLTGVVNDLRGDDPSKQVTNIPTFGGVTYSSVVPGVDLDFYGKGMALEYDFRLAPGVDPSVATTRIAGAERLRLTSGGDLIARDGRTRFIQQAPVAYQPATADEPRNPVQSAFRLDGDRVSFELGSYDPRRALVIDPVSLAYSTYLGGSDSDYPAGIAVDQQGAAFVTGYTSSTDFDTVNPIEAADGGGDVFVSKLSPAGDALVYSTYLGGDGDDIASGIDVDSSGAAFVSGTTASTDFNTVGPIEGDSGDGDYDAFVSKLTPSGSGLAYSTYLGGDGDDAAIAIALDASEAAYVTGYTSSTDLDSVGPIEGPNGTDGLYDAFVSKLAPSGNALAYSTYLGGADEDIANAIAVGAGGAAYVGGRTGSDDFNTVNPIEGDSPSFDAFVSKLTPAGGALAYSTYLGGGGSDSVAGVAVDAAGAAYVTGNTSSTDFNTVNPVEGDSASTDAFVSKLAPAGGALAYSTYLGGGGEDLGRAIAVGSDGSAYLAGDTTSTDFNLVSAAEGNSAGDDAFVAKLTPAADAFDYSTYLGGNGDDRSVGVAVDAAGIAYIVGQTGSTDFDTVDPIEGDSGSIDNFVSKLLPPDSTPPESRITKAPKRTIRTNARRTRVEFRFSASEPGSSFECSLDAAAFDDCDSPVVRQVDRGSHSFKVRAADAAGNTDATPARAKFTIKRKPRRR